MGRERKPTRVIAPSLGVACLTRLTLTSLEMLILSEAVDLATTASLKDMTRFRLSDTDRYALMGKDDSTNILPSELRQSIIRKTNSLSNVRRANLKLNINNHFEAISHLKKRLGALTQDTCSHAPLKGEKPSRGKPCKSCKDGYKTVFIRAMKARRLDKLQSELKVLLKRRKDRDYRLMPGGKKRAKNRLHLAETGQSEQEWRDEWNAARSYYGIDGFSGRVSGNRMFRLNTTTRRLSIKLPRSVCIKYNIPIGKKDGGGWLTLSSPVRFKYLGDELNERITGREATRFDLVPTFKNGVISKMHLRASWTRVEKPAVTLDALQGLPVVGVDLNKGHLDAHLLDATGNPIGNPERIDFVQTGTSAQRDGELRAAITCLLNYATTYSAVAIVVEDLGFIDPTLREKGHSKSFNHTISGFPTAQFKTRIACMADKKDIGVVAVDPHHTSKRGGPAWQHVLEGGPTKKKPVKGSKVSGSVQDQITVTKHSGAAVAVGRRGNGFSIACGAGPTVQRKHGRSGSTVPTVGTPTNPTSTLQPNSLIMHVVRHSAHAGTGEQQGCVVGTVTVKTKPRKG